MARLRTALFSVLILGGGAAAAAALVAAKPEVEEVQQEPPVTMVEVVEVQKGTYRPRISAMGKVVAEKEVRITPEVSGTILEQNNALIRGGRIAKGDPLVRIDPRDYSTAVAASQADLAQARLAVKEESTLRQVAEHEWRDRPEGFSEETLAYALREPHLDAAKARVESARSRIAKAKRDLARTLVRAPFDAVVIDEAVDVGQAVSPQTQIARLAGIERYLVEVALPVSRLEFLDIPGVNAERDEGSGATVLDTAAGREPTEHDAYVMRLLGNADSRGRMAQVVLGVDDPLDLKKPAEQRSLPLILDTYVRVILEGRPIADVVELPRPALRDDGKVWVLRDDQTLESRDVDVVWRESGRVLVSNGLRTGDRVVTTALPVATDGMKVELAPPSTGSGSPTHTAQAETDAPELANEPEKDASP